MFSEIWKQPVHNKPSLSSYKKEKNVFWKKLGGDREWGHLCSKLVELNVLGIFRPPRLSNATRAHPTDRDSLDNFNLRQPSLFLIPEPNLCWNQACTIRLIDNKTFCSRIASGFWESMPLLTQLLLALNDDDGLAFCHFQEKRRSKRSTKGKAIIWK